MPTKTKTKPTTTTTPATKTEETKMLYSATIEARNVLRDELFATEDERQFHPLDYALIRPLVKEKYLAIFDDAVKTGEPCSIEIDLNQGFDPEQHIEENPGFIFVRGWIMANGKNRTPKPKHYGMLGDSFRRQFAPDATHWVIDANGMVANGGHSGHGTALGYYPESIFYGIYGTRFGDDQSKWIKFDSPEAQEEIAAYNDDYPNYVYADKEGYMCMSTQLGWKHEKDADDNAPKFERIGEYGDDGKGDYVAHSDSPDVRLGQNLTIVLRINADPTSCLKMDDVRLEASYDDYLEMVAPIKAYMQKLPKEVQEIAGTLFRNYYLRVNHGNESFGSLGKGGRLTKNEVQQWFVAGLPHLLDSLALITNELGVLRQFPHFTKDKGGKGGVSLANALVAMMVSSQSGRERIAEIITIKYDAMAFAKVKDSKVPAYFKKMVDYIVKSPGDNSKAFNADEIVQCLVFLGMGKVDPVASVLAAYPSGKKNPKTEEDIHLSSWQVKENRATGWDSSNTDDPAEEEFTDVTIHAAQRIAALLGSEGDVKNAKMKATRKGLGTRGRNKK